MDLPITIEMPRSKFSNHNCISKYAALWIYYPKKTRVIFLLKTKRIGLDYVDLDIPVVPYVSITKKQEIRNFFREKFYNDKFFENGFDDQEPDNGFDYLFFESKNLLEFYNTKEVARKFQNLLRKNAEDIFKYDSDRLTNEFYKRNGVRSLDEWLENICNGKLLDIDCYEIEYSCPKKIVIRDNRNEAIMFEEMVKKQDALKHLFVFERVLDVNSNCLLITDIDFYMKNHFDFLKKVYQ